MSDDDESMHTVLFSLVGISKLNKDVKERQIPASDKPMSIL